jgi:D-methionine transport system permease protein
MDPDLWRTLPRELATAFGETGLMVGIALCATVIVGLPLGAGLYAVDVALLWPRPWLRRLAGLVVNAIRATPFVILLVLLLPLTQVVVGSSIGPTAAAVPLAVAAVAFYARLVEGSLRETDQSAIEAALTLGASPLRILVSVVVPAAMPGLVRGLTVTTVSLIGLSAMAGIVGGGGVGDLAIRYGYYRYETAVMVATVLLLLLLVQVVQWGGDRIAARLER